MMRRALFPLTLTLSLLMANFAWAQEDFPGEEAPEAAPMEAPEAAPADPTAAPAEPAPMQTAAAGTAGEMYVGLTIGPAIGPVDEDYGQTLFYFGPEFGMKNFQIPLLFAFKDSVKFIDLIPRFKYSMELFPNLILDPFGGLKIGFSFADNFTGIGLGVEVGARGTYMVTPNIGVYLEPVVLDFNFFQWAKVGDNSDSDTGFDMYYRLHFGAQYNF